jgi:muramoyltetrapeptide carboxypeptidase
MTSSLVPPRVKVGDRVRLVSPASYPSVEALNEEVAILESWGLRPEVGEHALDPGVRAVVTTRGGAGSYRIIDDIDFDAARRDPKPVVGFSDISCVHLALWEHARVVGVHGMLFGVTGEATRNVLMNAEPIILHSAPTALSAEVSVEGAASGFLIGGNLGAIVGMVGAGLPSLADGILFFESLVGSGPEVLDQVLHQLIASGSLNGVRGVVIGHLTDNQDAVADRDTARTVTEVLQDRLGVLGVPILGGLPLGHDPDPLAVPLGTTATIDTTAGTLTVAPGVC